MGIRQFLIGFTVGRTKSKHAGDQNGGATVTPRPGRVYSTTTVGAYKSSKCHIVVFWRLK